MLRSRDWVLALPVTDDGRLVMVRQYRFGTRDLSTEAPGGIMEAGEDPRVTAARETEEETGFAGGRARLLGTCAPNPAIQANRCHFVLLEGVRPTGRRAPDELSERWSGQSWPAARTPTSLLAALPTGTFPGVDQTEVFQFLESHAPEH